MERSARSAGSGNDAAALGEQARGSASSATPGPDGQYGLLGEHDDADQRLARLARTIEGEIIPRLMLAHRTANACAPVATGVSPLGDADVAEFTRIVLADDEDAAMTWTEAVLARGVAVESVFLDLLAPTARRLGDMWTQDLCDFTDVTLGLGRLQRVLREVCASVAPGGGLTDATATAAGARRALMLPSPGEQHTFGLVMVSEIFRRAGWDVTGGPWEVGDEAPVLAGRDWYDIVGFSLAAEVHVDALARCIAAVREASRNGQVGIMVGGPLLGERPELAARLGADLISHDGRQAPHLAERFVAQRHRRI